MSAVVFSGDTSGQISVEAPSVAGSNTLTLPTATDTLVGKATTDTLTNKTLTAPVIATIVNTGTLTLPTSTDTLVGRATTDVLTNKTLILPVIASISNTGTLTLPTSTDTLVGRATTDVLTNKTLTAPVIATIVNTGTLTLPTSTDTLVGRATTDALTNKTYNGNTWTAGASTLTLAGNFVTSGAYNLTAALTANTSVTFPTSGTLAVVGGIDKKPLSTKITTYAVTPADGTIICTTTAFTVTLPTAVGLSGQKFTIKNANTSASGNLITMATTSSQTIDGLTPGTILPLVSQTFVSDNSNWWIVSETLTETTTRLQTATASSAVTVIDWRLGTYCIITLAANTSIEFDPLPDSLVVTMTLLFIQDGTGNHTVTFTPVTSGFTTVYTEDGQQPLIQPTAATRTELQAVLDPTSDTLRIRQGVIGEIAVA